ncbi:unnamed protein product [Clonostachys rosea f. rosea IK726]|uniref:Uncharacterized protein n=1 Tax=Clonostachys rosea f. rosea IK726 TaxID=1349383 RepID=A0ACA9TF54_BIOOC|nr:unnamed protein product [Clonostachys rosea f. rosea IK726]
MASPRSKLWTLVLSLSLLLVFFTDFAHASIGDRLPEFGQCLEPSSTASSSGTAPASATTAASTSSTNRRVQSGQPVVQFHGKWPFHRFLGMQEPLSVLWSLGNLLAHWDGLRKVRASIPPSYPLRPFYVALAWVGIASWSFSALFHTRDFPVTEQLDYFAAGANVLYGMYYTPIRIFRGIRWDYTYNMAANVACGIVQNILWSWFSYDRYRKSRRTWAIWPGLVVCWVMFAMSMELFDFPPWFGTVDAHSLWHLMTIFPTILWYNFLVKDAHDDMAGSERLKM